MKQRNGDQEEAVSVDQEAGKALAEQTGNEAGEGAVGGREGNGSRGHSPGSVEFPVVAPWPERVDGAELLDGIRKELQRFVVFPKWAAEVFALWILHTFAYWAREVTTYIGIESPEKECGKSTLVTVLSRFVSRPVVSSNISSSAFYRVIEELKPTLLIDEADTNLRGKDDLRGILNSGYTKSTAFVWRICYDGAGPDGAEEGDPPPVAPEREGPTTRAGKRGASPPGRVARYSCWCPKAIATIGPLHPTLASRCIVVRMQRKLGDEECERLKLLDATELARKCARFVADHGAEIGKAEPPIPKGLTNRAAEIWEPLLALADLAGGRWPGLAREAALGLTARAQEQSPIGSLLLDIFLVFIEAKRERVFSREVVAALQQSGDRPWVELRRGKQITETWLAQRLRPYGLKSRTIRIGEEVGRGYVQEEMMETFRRYIPKSEVEALKADLAERTEEGGEAGGDGEGKPGSI